MYMEKVKEKINIYRDKNLDLNLKKNYMKAMNDENFKTLVNKFKINEDTIIKNTSKFLKSCNNLKNCKGCRSIATCKNELAGYVYYPCINKNNLLTFKYLACKHKKKILKEDNEVKNVFTFNEPIEIKRAKMKDIFVDDKNRYPVIKYLKKFIDNYEKKEVKGLFLHGNFGCGKTYMISACLNEMSKKNINSAIVYWPEFLRTIKSSFNKPKELSNFDTLFDKVCDVEILLIDDIGAEDTTPWSRDEILGTILQSRMQNKLVTFMTSNLNIEELEDHLSITRENVDRVKARRIIERIKYMMEDIELISESRRK